MLLPWVLAAASVQPAAGDAVDRLDYALQVRPILSDKCFLCHGPDEGTREAGLRLDNAEGIADAFAGGVFDDSEAWRRIHSDDEYEVMPPPEAGKPLSPAEIATLRQWMAEGAESSGHWAFEPPKRRKPPEINADAADPQPSAGGASREAPRDEIDAFLLAKLRSNGLGFAPPAAKATLLRRVSFTLTGLPPTPSEVDAFLADASPGAYERVVDRLLASPRFGERLASDWLDAARYSDTFGYQMDEDRYVWPWRDWVIGALNAGTPYDEFITQQLAGDLLPGASRETILATTFNRLHPQNSEGGSIPEEFRAEYIADRTQTFATATLGLTMECCKCHDHKYDPLSQRDFYALSAFFDKIDEAGLKSYFTKSVPTPTLRLPTSEQSQQLQAAQQLLRKAEARVASVATAERQAALQAAGRVVDAAGGGSVTPKADLSLGLEDARGTPNRLVDGKVGKAIRLSGDDELIAGKGFAFERHTPFSISLWLRAEREHERAVILHRSRGGTDSASRGYELIIEQGRLSPALVHFWPGNAVRVRAVEPLALGRWVHVAMTYDGSSKAAGLRLYVDGRPAPVEVVRDCLTKTMVDKGRNEVAIGARTRDRGFTDGSVDELRIYPRQLSAVEVRREAVDGDADASGLTDEDRFEHYLLTSSEAYAKALAGLRACRERLFKLQDGVAEIMVMREHAAAPVSRVRLRGAYDSLGEAVGPAPPSVLPGLPAGRRADRLALAEWLFEPGHPLTARVAVNRYWQLVFGEGLVRTPEDFGSQGQSPTHPQLLDNLALDFSEGGWDIKALLKRLVMTAAYRQSSIAPAETVAADPENLLWGRAGRRRLPAEMLRDNALAASGLLSGRIGGPPAKPYDLEAAFKPVRRGAGDALYRRSVYTYWKRSAPAPLMTAFDAPDRSVCRVKRERTMSPLQSLVMLNSPQFIEAARVLAEQSLALHGADDAAVIRHAFLALISRAPTADETRLLAGLLDRQTRAYSEKTDAASALLAIGDRPHDAALPPARLAAATIVVQTIMNLDLAVTHR
ncbi:MAG: DUF1553 domain-containing protein [Planctomycetota bacterium]